MQFAWLSATYVVVLPKTYSQMMEQSLQPDPKLALLSYFTPQFKNITSKHLILHLLSAARLVTANNRKTLNGNLLEAWISQVWDNMLMDKLIISQNNQWGGDSHLLYDMISFY